MCVFILVCLLFSIQKQIGNELLELLGKPYHPDTAQAVTDEAKDLIDRGADLTVTNSVSV